MDRHVVQYIFRLKFRFHLLKYRIFAGTCPKHEWMHAIQPKIKRTNTLECRCEYVILGIKMPHGIHLDVLDLTGWQSNSNNQKCQYSIRGTVEQCVVYALCELMSSSVYSRVSRATVTTRPMAAIEPAHARITGEIKPERTVPMDSPIPLA